MAEQALVVEREEAEDGSWGGVTGSVDPRLGGAVEAVTGWWEDAPGPQRHRHLPSGTVTLILGTDELRMVEGPGSGPGANGFRAFVAGLHEGPALSEHDGRQSGVEVKLTPLGARRLLGVPMHELAGRVVALDDVLGRGAHELGERLDAATGWPERLEVTTEVLVRRLAEAPAPDPRLVFAWQRLACSQGTLPIGHLAQEVGWSRRHLAERFRHEVGVAPKAAARLLRFSRAVELLGRPGHPPLAELAAGCGYYDQAHLNREFRAMSGSTPTAWLDALLPSGATAA